MLLIATDAAFFQLNLTANWGMFCFCAFLYCHPIPCQLRPGVGGRKSISHDATWGLHGQSELVLQSFLLSAEFSKRSVPSSHNLLCCFIPVLIKYGAGMLVPAQPMGNWTFFPQSLYKFIINQTVIRFCLRLEKRYYPSFAIFCKYRSIWRIHESTDGVKLPNPLVANVCIICWNIRKLMIWKYQIKFVSVGLADRNIPPVDTLWCW